MGDLVRVYNRRVQAVPVQIMKEDGQEETVMIPSKGYV